MTLSSRMTIHGLLYTILLSSVRQGFTAYSAFYYGTRAMPGLPRRIAPRGTQQSRGQISVPFRAARADRTATVPGRALVLGSGGITGVAWGWGCLPGLPRVASTWPAPTW